MPDKRFATKDDLLAIASEASGKYLDAADYHRALTWGEAKDLYTWGTIKGASDTSGQTTTANLQLVKPGYGSSLDIASINANSDTLDTAIKAVQDATDALEDARANLNALLGNLGLNAQGQPLIDAASARSTLGAATDGNSGTTLYAAQQAIATNASAISTLQDSVNERPVILSYKGTYSVPANDSVTVRATPTNIPSGYTACAYRMVAFDTEQYLAITRLDMNSAGEVIIGIRNLGSTSRTGSFSGEALYMKL